MKLDKNMLKAVVEDVYHNQSAIILTDTEDRADRAAKKFGAIASEYAAAESAEHPLDTTLTLTVSKNNPRFIRFTHAAVPKFKAFVFFHPATDVEADEEIGTPDWVWWPTEGLDYNKLAYTDWQNERRKGTIWRPVTTAGVIKKPKGPRTTWDRLLEDDDD